MIEIITAISIWEIAKNGVTWMQNLKRASDARKKESRNALQKVVLATTRTSMYLRQRQETGASRQIESDLAILWTELSFELKDIGIKALAKKCQVKGRYWQSPDAMDKEFLDKADVGLETIRKIAKELLTEIDK